MKDRIKKIRTDAGLSQSDFAKNFQFRVPQYVNWSTEKISRLSKH